MDQLVVLNSIKELREYRNNIRQVKNIGFVPTMGCLHEGHLSLVKKSIIESDVTIVSIYVNPSQFGKNEDLDKYPRVLQRDLDLLGEYEVDAVFCPRDEEMYPEGYTTWVEELSLSGKYCGESRPTHFKGVTTIVAKLLNLVQPHFMYMGEKDFQQIAVLNKMIKDLNYDTVIRPCPIIRENDGLAMSSRNIYLSDIERTDALCLYKSLLLAKEMASKGEKSVSAVKERMMQIINLHHGKPDYIEFVNRNTLSATEEIDKDTHVIMAVYVGKTRLIDNMQLIGR